MFEIQCSLEMFGRHKEGDEKSKEAVNLAIHNLIERVKLREEIKIIKETYNEPVPMEKAEGFFLASVELMLKIENFESLVGFMIDFGPSHLEIIKPSDTVKLDINEIESGLNEALFKIQDLDKKLKITENMYRNANSMYLSIEKQLKGNSDEKKA